MKPPHDIPHDSRSGEQAVGVTELVVVCLIVAIILAIAVPSIGGARRTGDRAAAVAVATAYQRAAERFALDHRGRAPEGPGSEDWPGGDAAARGPVDAVVGTTRPYLRSVPEAVQDRRVAFAPTGEGPRVWYRRAGATSFWVEVRVPGRRACGAGPAVPAGTPSCGS